MKMALGILGGLLLLVILIIAWASYPWSLSGRKERKEIVVVEPEMMVSEDERPAVLKVLTWNIGYLYGKGSEGDDGYHQQDKSFYEEKLEKMVEQIKEWDADIICLQEVDFDADRSQNINQARYVAEHAGYPYVAEAISWEANYIPFPYWPPARHFGSIRSGGAILSRYPIVEHEVELLSKPQANPWWYNLFYLHRYFQKVKIEAGGKSFNLINLHLEAFDKTNREEEIKELTAKIKKENIDLVVGDFNMVPTGATKKSGFPESSDGYEGDKSFELMKASELSEAIPEDIYLKDETSYFTFPSWKPDRRLDYIFYRNELKMMRAEILNSEISDHLPLKATFQIGAPKYDPMQSL